MILNALLFLASIVVFAVFCFVGIKLGKKLFCVSQKIQARKRAILKLAISLREYGLRILPSALESYVLADAVGMFDTLQDVAKLTESSDALMKDLEKTFEACLDKKLATPEGRAYIVAKLADAK